MYVKTLTVRAHGGSRPRRPRPRPPAGRRTPAGSPSTRSTGRWRPRRFPGSSRRHPARHDPSVDAECGEFQRGLPHQMGGGGLRNHIGDADDGRRPEPGDRRGHDDSAAPTRLHVRHRGTDRGEYRCEIRFDDPVPQFLGHVLDGAAESRAPSTLRNPGPAVMPALANTTFQPAGSGRHPGNRFAQRRPIRHVDHYASGRRTASCECSNGLIQRMRIDIEQRHLRAVIRLSPPRTQSRCLLRRR